MRPPKPLLRLILCLDGTWNTDRNEAVTNVVRLRDLVEPKWPKGSASPTEIQLTYYDEGVGTGGFLDMFLGGGIGGGISQNVLQAYRFLVQNYAPGAEIYLFGFSRGAYAARSLAGMIGAVGILTPDKCSTEMLVKVWALYRIPPKDRSPAAINKIRKHTRQATVTCIGVFDTVGSLGIPFSIFRQFNRRRFEFHTTTLCSNVLHAFQALAIDEKRGPFEAAMWNCPDHEEVKTVEQVWFPGVHGSIGGVYKSTDLSDIVLEWMMDRIKANDLSLRLRDNWKWSPRYFRAEMPDSCRHPLYFGSRIRPKMRVICQAWPPASWRYRLAGLPKQAEPIGEMLHWTALARAKETAGAANPYRPANLWAAIPYIYRPPVWLDHLPVVGKKNAPLDWQSNPEDDRELQSLLPEPFASEFQQIPRPLRLVQPSEPRFESGHEPIVPRIARTAQPRN
jgi:hypothetical protein